jgi:hypothetical protein
MEVTIHEPGGAMRSCPGPARSGHCALHLAGGLPPGCRPVPCAGRTVTVSMKGLQSTWQVSPGITRCFVPALGNLLCFGSDAGPRTGLGPISSAPAA